MGFEDEIFLKLSKIGAVGIFPPYSQTKEEKKKESFHSHNSESWQEYWFHECS